MNFRRMVLGGALAPAAIFTIALTAVASAVPAAQASMNLPSPGRGQGLSQNWAGYVVNGGRYHSVSATWVQPAAHCTSKNTGASFWVGLDGGSGIFSGRRSKTLEQVGSAAYCAGGTPQYFAWWEMFPSPMHVFQHTVRPGDHLRASVKASGTAFTLTFYDITRGWHRSVHRTQRAARKDAAEVIAEAPTNGSTHRIRPLTNFGTVSFFHATFNGKPLHNFNTGRLTMENPRGRVKARPSALSASGKHFTVRWRHV